MENLLPKTKNEVLQHVRNKYPQYTINYFTNESFVVRKNSRNIQIIKIEDLINDIKRL